MLFTAKALQNGIEPENVNHRRIQKCRRDFRSSREKTEIFTAQSGAAPETTKTMATEKPAGLLQSTESQSRLQSRFCFNFCQSKTL